MTIVLRYPGGKQRQLRQFASWLPALHVIDGDYIEPFVGGGAVFFSLCPNRAVLTDINSELINLYRAVQCYPEELWEVFSKLRVERAEYYRIRAWNPEQLGLVERAARTLYLNRTCFKGMWRHNARGQFNVGYGGPDRRWVITRETLFAASEALRHARLECCDFEVTIDAAAKGDFLFVDPPYRPGERDLRHAHYTFGHFSYEEQVRLAAALERASARGVLWAMTNSAHPDILALYPGTRGHVLKKGTGRRIGELVSSPGEVFICNY